MIKIFLKFIKKIINKIYLYFINHKVNKIGVDECFLNKNIWLHYVDYGCRLLIK